MECPIGFTAESVIDMRGMRSLTGERYVGERLIVGIGKLIGEVSIEHLDAVGDDELQQGVDLLRRNLELRTGEYLLVLEKYPLIVKGDQLTREHVSHYLSGRRPQLYEAAIASGE